MTRVKQVGPPIMVVAFIAGIIGYIIGCTREQREQTSQVRAQETASPDACATEIAQEETVKIKNNSRVFLNIIINLADYKKKGSPNFH